MTTDALSDGDRTDHPGVGTVLGFSTKCSHTLGKPSLLGELGLLVTSLAALRARPGDHLSSHVAGGGGESLTARWWGEAEHGGGAGLVRTRSWKEEGRAETRGPWAPQPAGLHGAFGSPHPSLSFRSSGSQAVKGRGRRWPGGVGRGVLTPSACSVGCWLTRSSCLTSLWRGGALAGRVCQFLWCKCFMADLQLPRRCH